MTRRVRYTIIVLGVPKGGVSLVSTEIRVLGVLEVIEDGIVVPVRRQKLRQLLCILAIVDGDWIPAEEIQLQLWSDEATRPKNPKQALQTVISRARHLLGENRGAIESTGRSYRLDRTLCPTDLAEWRDLVDQARGLHTRGQHEEAAAEYQRARSLWRSDDLARGETMPVVALERARLLDLRADHAIEEAAVLVGHGHASDAAVLLLEAASYAPLREDVVSAALDALVDAGRHSRALRAAATYRQRIRMELGATPSNSFLSQERTLLGLDAADNPSTAVGVQTASRTERSDSVRARVLVQMTEGDQDVITCAAGLGPRVDATLIAVTLASDLESVLTSLGNAAALGLIEIDEDRLGSWKFQGSTKPEEILALVDLATIRQTRNRAAQILSEAGGSIDRIAELLIGALPLGDPAHVSAMAVAGAETRLARRDFLGAADLFASASKLASTPADSDRLRLRQAKALENTAGRSEANRIFDELFGLADATSDWWLLAESALGGSGHASRVGGQSDRRRRLTVALNRLPTDWPRLDEVASELGLEMLLSGTRMSPALWSRLQVLSSSADSTAHLLALRVVMAIREMQVGVERDDVKSLAERSLLALASGEDELIASAALATACQHGLTHGMWRETEAWCAELLAFGARSGDPRAKWQPLAYLASMASARGQLEETRSLLSQAHETGVSLGMDDAKVTVQLHLFADAYRNGSTAAFLPYFQSDPNEVRAGHRRSINPVLCGIVELDAGNEFEARRLLRSSVDTLAGSLDVFRPAAIALTCDLAACLTRPDELVDLVDELKYRRGTLVFLGYGGPLLGPVDWFISRYLLAKGDTDGSRELSIQATRTCERLDVAWTPPPRNAQ